MQSECALKTAALYRLAGSVIKSKKIVERMHASAGYLLLLSVFFSRSMLAAARRGHDPALQLAVLTS